MAVSFVPAPKIVHPPDSPPHGNGPAVCNHGGPPWAALVQYVLPPWGQRKGTPPTVTM